MKEIIRQQALHLGFDQCRFTTAQPPGSGRRLEEWLKEGRHGNMAWLQRNADKRLNPDLVLPGVKSFIVVAASHAVETQVDSTIRGAGVIARYARHADYHGIIGEKLRQLTLYVNQLAGVGTRSIWYVDTGPILERDLAQRAGLGFVGKHTNLISRRLGNWFFLGEILTTLELEPDVPEKNHCGHCSRCLTSCPTGAITGPFQLDARRCISYLTIELKESIPLEWRRAIGNRIYGCDDCLAACPWNRFARAGKLMKPHLRADLGEPNLLELLALNDADFKKQFADSPILRTKRRGFLRNVCVALGNVGGRDALPHLEKAATDSEPLVAEHARWAIQEIESRTN